MIGPPGRRETPWIFAVSSRSLIAYDLQESKLRPRMFTILDALFSKTSCLVRSSRVMVIYSQLPRRPRELWETVSMPLRRNHAKTQTRKEELGSLRSRAWLYGAELWLRSAGRQAGGDFADSIRRRTGRDIVRHRRSLRPVPQ